jgi:hypothetical protein
MVAGPFLLGITIGMLVQAIGYVFGASRSHIFAATFFACFVASWIIYK